MTRRLSLPAVMTAILACLMIVVIPGLSGTSRGYALEVTGTPDPCLVNFAVQGIVLSDMFIYDQPSDKSGLPLIKLLKTDRVEVLGQNDSGFWALIRTNSGVVGWIASPQLFVERKVYNNFTMVPQVANLPTVTPTLEGTTVAEDPFANCPALAATIVSDGFRLRTRPASNADDIGVTVRKGDRVSLIASNPEELWLLVRTSDKQEGWILSAYVSFESAQLARVRRDYTYYEQTLTPHP